MFCVRYVLFTPCVPGGRGAFSRHRNARGVLRQAKRRSAHLSALALVLAILALSAGGVSPAASARAQEPPLAPASVSSDGRIVISEVAAGSSRSDADSFFELRNIDDHAIDLTGWQVFRCSAQGLRSNYSRPESDLSGVVLEPGAIVTVARVGVDLGGRRIIKKKNHEYEATGVGLILEINAGAIAVYRVGYPTERTPTVAECG